MGFIDRPTSRYCRRPYNSTHLRVQLQNDLSTNEMNQLPKVLLAGGPDIDARLELMHHLNDAFNISALGSSPKLKNRFLAEGFDYKAYRLSRRANPLLDLMTIGQALLVLRKMRPEIVHTFDSKPSVWIRLAARMAGVPVIVGTLPGLGSLYMSEGLLTRVIRLIYERLQMLACRVSDITVFQNPDDAQHFVSAGVVSPEKTQIIFGSGVATDLFSQSEITDTERALLRDELGIQPGEIVVSMVGRVIRTKGVLEFSAVAKEVSARYPNVRFLLVGAVDGESLDRLDPEELNQLRQNLIWPGPREDIPVILAISTIFVLPAYREGIPRVLLEAASMGLPIVTTNSPGCRDVVEDEANGILVPVRDAPALLSAIIRLIEQPELCLKFGRLSRKRAIEQFDISIVAERTRLLYQELWVRKVQPNTTRL